MTGSRLRFVVGVCLTGAMTLGCGGKDRWQAGRPPVVECGGMLTHDDSPVPDAVITLLPVTGRHSAFARSGSDGTFQLTTFDANDGAVAGDYKVTVTRIVVENEPNPKEPEHLPPLHHAEYSLLPEDYADAGKTSLTLTIPQEGAKDLALALTGKPTGRFDKGKPKFRK